MPRRLLISVIVLLLASSIIIGFVFIRNKSASGVNPLKAIPVDAAFILQINNFHSLSNSLIKENRIWTGLYEILFFRDLTNKIRYIDSLIKDNSDFAEIALKSKAYISGHYIGGRKSEYLCIVSLPPGKSDNNIIDLLSKITNQNLKKTVRKYEGKSIYTIKITDKAGTKNSYLVVAEGNIIFSKSVVLTENSIRQLSLTKSLSDDTEFAKILSTAGKNKDANLFVDLRKFAGLISNIASDNFREKIKNYKDFAGWAEYDINLTENQIILNGFLLSEGSKDTFLEIFKDSNPVMITSDKILPASISAFLTMGIDNVEKINKNLGRYFGEIEKASIRKNELRKIENSYGLNPEKLFLSITDNELTVAQDNTEGTSLEQSTYVMIKCKSGNQAHKQLNDAVTQICTKKGINIQKQHNIYSIDNETKFEIVEFPIENITGIVYGGLFKMHDRCFYTFLGNYLIFGQSVDALGHLLYCNVLNKTLSTNEAYRSFSSNIDPKSYLLFYTNLGRSSNFFSTYFDHKIFATWEKHSDIFQTIQPLGIQITEVSNMKYCNILIQYIKESRRKPQTIWESLLDTSFNFKPQLVLNHYTKQNEIFLQDLDNNIYLINKAGRIIWKQKIAEQINSTVYQIDYYKNGKLQLLFSTENYLHLIDRDGNYIERYPLRLRTRSSAGMSLFDYENNKNYRIFIPCIDNKIYAYALDGSIISGWQFRGSDYPVDQPVNHFQSGDKDYIVFGDKYHTYILDRRGSVRIAIDEIITKSKNNNYIFDNTGTTEKSRIIITDTTGNIISIYYDGHMSTSTVGVFSNNHFFDFKDVDADGEKDYIFVDNNNIDVFRQNKSKIFSYVFAHAIKEKPVYFRFSSSDRKLGLVDKEDQNIYLLNSNGSVYKGFPLVGTTLFSIGYLEDSEGSFNLIVGGRNNFLYNYSVQ
jgi:hypothetical protein